MIARNFLTEFSKMLYNSKDKEKKIEQEFVEFYLALRSHSSNTNKLKFKREDNSVADSSVISNHADALNSYCLGLCGRDICPKSSGYYGSTFFNPQL